MKANQSAVLNRTALCLTILLVNNSLQNQNKNLIIPIKKPHTSGYFYNDFKNGFSV